jgi:hypothetical protein
VNQGNKVLSSNVKTLILIAVASGDQVQLTKPHVWNLICLCLVRLLTRDLHDFRIFSSRINKENERKMSLSFLRSHCKEKEDICIEMMEKYTPSETPSPSFFSSVCLIIHPWMRIPKKMKWMNQEASDSTETRHGIKRRRKESARKQMISSSRTTTSAIQILLPRSFLETVVSSWNVDNCVTKILFVNNSYLPRLCHYHKLGLPISWSNRLE